MKVADVYRPSVTTCSPKDTLRRVARAMARSDTGFVVLVDDGELVGVVSERDVVRALARERRPGHAPVAQHATRHTLTATLGEDVASVARRMLDAHVRRMPVLGSAGDVVGVVSMRDLFAVEVLAHPRVSSEEGSWNASSTIS